MIQIRLGRRLAMLLAALLRLGELLKEEKNSPAG